MGYDIDSPREAGTTRRDVLSVAAVLLAGGAFTVAGPAPHAAAESEDDGGEGGCGAGYDEEFEEALAEADEAIPEDRALAPQGPPGRFALPLRRRFRVTARYGVRGNWLAGHHTGIDLAVPSGTPVHAVGAGTVVLARWSGAYGKAVTVRLRDGHYAVYAHLSRISVRQGARIGTGDRLGSSGATGRATGPHLHLEIRARRGYGSDVNPVSYLARRGARLL
ncbi:M23 family metallopeptidase [Streptomyces durmitorensis]|uniref:M23 family metallopeptidase n=1 Tax=Streptomyces durmitorensis TaxID=319947 RepID=A0ABY4Q437_9ACTN|nr:M23 family metallopeptidase [Streptomyces durmitorensis]UQT60130.1 M23 family metallopeptidase [Streptomyces durmitorensis]